MIWYDVISIYDLKRYGRIRYDMIVCNMAREIIDSTLYDDMWYKFIMVWYDMIWYDMIWYVARAYNCTALWWPSFYCAVIHCTALHSATAGIGCPILHVLYYIMMPKTRLKYDIPYLVYHYVPYCTVLYSAIHFDTLQYCNILLFSLLNLSLWWCPTLRTAALYYTVLY